MINLEGPSRQATSARWSNRILILSLLGIGYLTLFPFRFDFSPSTLFHRYPFLLDTSVKNAGHLDFILNVLLFVPYGFGLSAQARKRGGIRWTTFLLVAAGGALLSYTVELMQFYIPERDSGWEDVFSNSLGSVTGFLLFQICGVAILDGLSKCEDLFERWLAPRGAALLLVAYFAACFCISVLLQNQTRLSNWDPQCFLFVGSDASGEFPWKGRVSLLQIWNRALPEQTIRQLVERKSAESVATGLLASYDFTNSPPYRDKTNFSPELIQISDTPQSAHTRGSEFDGGSELRTQIPVENLTREIKKTDHFTFHIVCTPAATDGAIGRIVSLSQSDDNINFHLRQFGEDLVLWFRNPLSETHSRLAWGVRGAFEAGKSRDIVATYDGSDAYLYLDGDPVPQTYRLSPGASLRHTFALIQTDDLQAYVLVYQTLLFLPAGLLIGIASRKWAVWGNSARWILPLGIIIPAVLLEILLHEVSGRRIWPGNIALSLAFGLAGALLINADGRAGKYSHVS
jgi:VanZ family protein